MYVHLRPSDPASRQPCPPRRRSVDIPAPACWLVEVTDQHAVDLPEASADNFHMTERRTSRPYLRLVEAFGETKSVSAWARDPRCAVSYPTLYNRLARAGWPPELALTIDSQGCVVALGGSADSLGR